MTVNHHRTVRGAARTELGLCQFEHRLTAERTNRQHEVATIDG
jgi:hypothetical protein